MNKLKWMASRFKYLALAFLVAGTVAPSQADEAQTETVTAEGVGKTEASAKKAAFKDAIQKVVGVLVDSSTQVKNEEIIKDELLEYSGGFISKSEVLSSKKDDEGLVRVKVKCVVEKTQVKKKLENLNLLTVKVDGSAFAQKEASKDEMRTDASKMLANAFEERKNLYKLKVPTKISDLKREEDGTVYIPVEVYFNQSDYQVWSNNWKKLFEKVMADKLTGYSTFKINSNNGVGGKMLAYAGKKLVDENNNVRPKSKSEEGGSNRKEMFFINVAESFGNNGSTRWVSYKIEGDMTKLPGMVFSENEKGISLKKIATAKLFIELQKGDGSIVSGAETSKFGFIEWDKNNIKRSACIKDPANDKEARGFHEWGQGSELSLFSLPHGPQGDCVELGPLPGCGSALAGYYPTYGMPGGFGSVFKFKLRKEDLGKIEKITARLDWE
jgi:hypothetical protein